MKRQTALYMLEWFVYTVVAVGFGRGGLADAGRRRGLDGRVDHAGAVCGPAGACGALLPVLEHRRVGRHAPAGLAFPGMGRHGWFMGGWLNPRTLGWAQDALCLVYVVILAAAWRKDPGVGWKTPSGSFRP